MNWSLTTRSAGDCRPTVMVPDCGREMICGSPSAGLISSTYSKPLSFSCYCFLLLLAADFAERAAALSCRSHCRALCASSGGSSAARLANHHSWLAENDDAAVVRGIAHARGHQKVDENRRRSHRDQVRWSHAGEHVGHPGRR